jgi:hypothetical protein
MSGLLCPDTHPLYAPSHKHAASHYYELERPSPTKMLWYVVCGIPLGWLIRLVGVE